VFDVTEALLVVCDARVPLVAGFDISSGSVRRVHTWPLSPSHRKRPVANDVLTIGDTIFVSSPAAGGIVKIDRAGAVAVIPLDAEPGALAMHGEILWVVASSEWEKRREENAGCEGNQAQIQDFGYLVRASAAPRRGHGMRTDDPGLDRLAFGREADTGGLNERNPDAWAASTDSRGSTIPGGELDPYRVESIGQRPSQPLWRITSDKSERIPLEADVIRVYGIGDDLAVVCRRGSEAYVSRKPGGPVSFRESWRVLVGRSAEQLVSVGDFQGDGMVVLDNKRVWLLGFSDYASTGRAGRKIRELDLYSGCVLPALDLWTIAPRTVISDTVVDIPHYSLSFRDHETVRFLPVDGGKASETRLPAFREFGTWMRAKGGVVWFGPFESTYIAFDRKGRRINDLTVRLDIASMIPAPVPPTDLDSAAFESRMLEEIGRVLRSEWVDQNGKTRPFMEGVTIETVELRGRFPNSRVVALFRSQERPDRRYGYEWPLWDEVGNPIDYDGLEMSETLESGIGIGKFDKVRPDEDGVMWI
jgi:hypothetical protein